jgi:hypothetical protein
MLLAALSAAGVLTPPPHRRRWTWTRRALACRASSKSTAQGNGGLPNYRARSLRNHEVVLTFDDGPASSRRKCSTLAKECARDLLSDQAEWKACPLW